MIKCKFWTNGCLQIMKVSQIEKHDETCEFGKTDCQYPECVQKTTKGKEQIHSENCPFSLYVCDKGCGKEMKLIEVLYFSSYIEKLYKINNNIKRNSHNCLGWLQTVIENLQIKNTVINEENKDIKADAEEINNKFMTVSNQLDKEIKNMEAKNSNLIAENEKLEQDIKNEMTKTKQKLNKKITEVNSSIEERFDVYSERANKEYELFNRRVNDQFSAFLQKNNEQLYDFNVRVQADSYHIAGVPNDMKTLDQNPLRNTLMTSPNKGNVSKILGSSLNKSQISPVPEKNK